MKLEKAILAAILPGFILFLCLCLVDRVFAISAFPGAEGYGSDATGGRGGTVYIVNQKGDSGAGSFRDAVTAAGARIVVFSVSGLINLTSGPISLTNDDITIAGQTSPGGIAVTGDQLLIGGDGTGVDNVIITHLRILCGDGGCSGSEADSWDCIRIWNSTNVIVDHSTVLYGIDETFSVVNSAGSGNITISWSSIGVGLSLPSECQHSETPNHSMAFLWNSNANSGDGMNLSLHHNFFHNSRVRVPGGWQTGSVQLVMNLANNVSFNWHSNNGRFLGGGGGPNYDIQNNYLKDGPHGSGTGCEFCAIDLDANLDIFAEGNLGKARTSQSDTEWDAICGDAGGYCNQSTLSTAYQVGAAQTSDGVTVTTMSENYARYVVQNAGATQPVQSNVEKGLISGYIRNNDGWKADTTPANTRDFGYFENPTAPADSDSDGMPDWWEDENGLNKSVADDTGTDLHATYTNLEVYLHFRGGYSKNRNSTASIGINGRGIKSQ